MTQDDTFIAITPFGQVAIAFDEEAGSTMSGDPDAVAHLVDVMGRCTGPLGASITPQNLEPNTLVHFCQPAGSLVVIVPPASWQADVDEAEDEPLLDAASAAVGHGWVTPRPDGARAKCGGPFAALGCAACREELQALSPLERARLAGAALEAARGD